MRWRHYATVLVWAPPRRGDRRWPCITEPISCASRCAVPWERAWTVSRPGTSTLCSSPRPVSRGGGPSTRPAAICRASPLSGSSSRAGPGAAGQGALALQVGARSSWAEHPAVLGLDDVEARRSVELERRLLRDVGGGCQVPLGAWSRSGHECLLHLVGASWRDAARVGEAPGVATRRVAAGVDAAQVTRVLERELQAVVPVVCCGACAASPISW